MNNAIKLTSSILDSNGILNGEELTKVFFSGILKGISLLFDSPTKIFIWVIIIGLIILNQKLKSKIRRKRNRQISRYQRERYEDVYEDEDEDEEYN